MSQCQPGSTRPFPLQVPRQPQVWMRGTCAGEALLCCALLWFPFTGFEVARAPLEHHTLLLTPLLGTSSPFPSPSGPRLGLTQFSRAFQPGLWVCKQSREKQGHSRDTVLDLATAQELSFSTFASLVYRKGTAVSPAFGHG